MSYVVELPERQVFFSDSPEKRSFHSRKIVNSRNTGIQGFLK